jgi:hypothetical protein
LAIFNSFGKTPFVIDKFKTCVNGPINVLRADLTICGLMQSNPGLELFRDSTNIATSSSITGFRNKVCIVRCFMKEVGSVGDCGISFARVGPILTK